jgi:hypothetical protein
MQPCSVEERARLCPESEHDRIFHVVVPGGVRKINSKFNIYQRSDHLYFFFLPARQDGQGPGPQGLQHPDVKVCPAAPLWVDSRKRCRPWANRS